MTRTILSLCALLIPAGLSAVAVAEDGLPVGTQVVAVLEAMKDSGVKGTVTFTQQKGFVEVSGEVSGLKPGEHGFHIHQFGDLRAEDGMSAGGHYNPGGHMHGGLESKERHAGDLGNIKANDKGVAKVSAKAEGLTVQEILGRSLVVHADADDLKTPPTGNSGARVAVGVIGLAEVKMAATPATPKK